MNTANEILKKHEDANEMHFHQVDREWIIEAMEECAKDEAIKFIKWVHLAGWTDSITSNEGVEKVYNHFSTYKRLIREDEK